jgi:hypothetical protein
VVLKRICRLHGILCPVSEPPGKIHSDHLANLLLFVRLSRPGGCAQLRRQAPDGLTPEKIVQALEPSLQEGLTRVLAHLLPNEPLTPGAAGGEATFQLPVKCPQHGWEVAAFLERRGQAEDTMAAILCEVARQHAESCEHFQLIVRYARQPLVPHGKAYSYARWMQGWAAVLLDVCRGGGQVVADGLCHVTTSR